MKPLSALKLMFSKIHLGSFKLLSFHVHLHAKGTALLVKASLCRLCLCLLRCHFPALLKPKEKKSQSSVCLNFSNVFNAMLFQSKRSILKIAFTLDLRPSQFFFPTTNLLKLSLLFIELSIHSGKNFLEVSFLLCHGLLLLCQTVLHD